MTCNFAVELAKVIPEDISYLTNLVDGEEPDTGTDQAGSMDLYLVTPSDFADAGPFFERTFGSQPATILFFPGPTGSGWDSATLQGVIFHVFNPAQGGFGNPDLETFLRGVFQGGEQLHALRAWCETPQNDDVIPFVCDELLPALADATGGVIFEDSREVYRGRNATARPGDGFPLLRALQRSTVDVAIPAAHQSRRLERPLASDFRNAGFGRGGEARLDLGLRERGAVDAELVERRSELGIAAVLRSAEPVVDVVEDRQGIVESSCRLEPAISIDENLVVRVVDDDGEVARDARRERGARRGVRFHHVGLIRAFEAGDHDRRRGCLRSQVERRLGASLDVFPRIGASEVEDALPAAAAVPHDPRFERRVRQALDDAVRQVDVLLGDTAR